MSLEARRRELCAKLERWRKWGALNEEATIQGLILPVLQAAGYDIHDLEQVYPQPRDSQGKYPDLMLFKTSPIDGGAEWCIIEAKKLGEALDKFVSQIGQYLTGSQARWYALTDGAEWRFYDKHKGQHNFHCITLTLEMPGALDALRCLLQPTLSEPDLEGAHRTLIEAQLREVARNTSWHDHCTGWRLTRALVYSLRTAVEQLTKQYPEHTHCVQQWATDFEKHLEQGEPPPWWGEAEENIPVSDLGEATAKRQEIMSFAQLKQQGFPVKNRLPQVLIINSHHIEARSWSWVLYELIKFMDAHECLPKPPFIPFWVAPLYATTSEGLGKYYAIQSKQYGTLYINQSSHTEARNRARAAYELLAHSLCSDINPETVQVIME